jgi:signal transduction histidine kinase
MKETTGDVLSRACRERRRIGRNRLGVKLKPPTFTPLGTQTRLVERLFKLIPFAAKLILIALIPMVFLVYLAIQYQLEKGEKVRTVRLFAERIAVAADIAALIDNLQEERKFSFDHAITGAPRNNIDLQRARTDVYLDRLKHTTDPTLYDFARYTELNKLYDIRRDIDSSRTSANVVMHTYSTIIFRLNTLSAIPMAMHEDLAPLYSDLAAQKIISEMLTYLGIIRSNIYNVLHTRQYMIETLLGTHGTYDVYRTYETELLVKAQDDIKDQYRTLKSGSAFRETSVYIDSLFSDFRFDSTYTAQQWWTISEEGTHELRKLQSQIWQRINNQLHNVEQHEITAQRRTLYILILIIIAVSGMVALTIYMITSTMRELRLAAQLISKGITDLSIEPQGNDVISDLAACIREIDRNNKILAEAAQAIGRGQFDVPVKPRSEADAIGNAIVNMKKELLQYREKMEQLVRQRTRELNRSNDDLRQFAHVASHDLKEPLRKISIFSNRLIDEQHDVLNERGRNYLEKIQHASARMSSMVEGVLNYSIVNADLIAFEPVDLNAVMADISNDLELSIAQKNATLVYDTLPVIKGVPILIHQLFTNLIANALKFVKEDVAPRIEITHRPATPDELMKLDTMLYEQFSCLQVRDNGIGFDPDYASQIFAVFKRLNAREQYEGTGLGLALCKKIVERHGGVIEASGKVNEGAVFTIWLPVK